MSQEDFQYLIKNAEDKHDNWGVHEVLKASIILSTYHGMCGLCFGMGLEPDADVVEDLLQVVGPQVL